MTIDLLIVGQGLSGSWLSHECRQAGIHFMVIDTVDPFSPSRISAGIINPITGRRHVEVWLCDEILTQSTTAYTEMGDRLKIPLIRRSTLIDFFPSMQMRDSFQERITQGGKYVSMHNEQEELPFKHPYGIGHIDPVYLADLPAFLKGCRDRLKENNELREERFDLSHLQLGGKVVQYKDLAAERIIFCDGVSGPSTRLFPSLPFAPNKGEVLILDIPGLSPDRLYKHGLILTPLPNGSWWVGSNYQWSFDHPHPTPEFREQTMHTLENWLKLPFRVIDHWAGIRPATRERRPFVGMLPSDPRIGLLNGMGTKGCSLAPFFARQLVQNLIDGQPIHPEASLERFSHAS